MICTVTYGPKSFGEKDEFKPIVEAIGAYDKDHQVAYFRGHSFFIGDGGIHVTLHYANQRVPDFLEPLKPLNVRIYDSVDPGWGEGELPSGVYEYGQSTAHVETVKMQGGSRKTHINIEGKNVKSALTLLRKVRAGAIQPKEAWVI